MKEILKKQVQAFAGTEGRYNALREGLQYLILKILDDEGCFKKISFVGGTALRVLFDLKRFSEDLDFSLQKPGDPRFQFEAFVSNILKQLAIYQLPADTKVKTKGAVRSVFFRFPGLLQEFGIIQRRGQKISIKLEIDTNPPNHAGLDTKIVQKQFMFTIVHHDIPTLFGGKLLAFLFRNYTKGRDLHDLLWFCSRKTPLNRRYFESGLKQALGKSETWSIDELTERLANRIKAIDFRKAAADLLPFLDDPAEIRFIDPDLLTGALREIRYQG